MLTGFLHTGNLFKQASKASLKRPLIKGRQELHARLVNTFLQRVSCRLGGLSHDSREAENLRTKIEEVALGNFLI